MLYRNEDLDIHRCKPSYTESAIQYLRDAGIDWQEGPDIGGPLGPYNQSERMPYYKDAWKQLKDKGIIYPSVHSRKQIKAHANEYLQWERISAPHEEEEQAEILFPKQWRPGIGAGQDLQSPNGVNWRFRVPDGQVITFKDEHYGKQKYIAGKDFGDFLVWRKDGIPAYELAVVVDDIAMQISEVVRGADLLKSTARQLLIYQALNAKHIPKFYHCDLVRDASGKRLAKRDQSTP